MIHKDGFFIGQKVRFQDNNFCWRQGEIVEIKWREFKIVGPGGRMIEARPTKLMIAFKDAFHGGWTERELPVKRVRPLEEASA